MSSQAGLPDAAIVERLGELVALAPAGFAIALHIRFQTAAYVFQTYPTAWMEEYGREGLVMRDPLVAWGFANTGHVAWAALEGEDPAGVIARARAHGLRHGLAVSVDRGSSRSFGGFARGDRPFAAEECDRIAAHMDALHDDTAVGRGLSSESREALRRLSVAFTHP